MIYLLFRVGLFVFSFSLTCLQGAPDISNLNNCIYDVRKVAANPPDVPLFDPYMKNYEGLLVDLQKALPNLPHVYQEAAAKPLIQFLENLGESKFLQIFAGDPADEMIAILQEIIPDAALAILLHQDTLLPASQAFEEIVSDLYDGFLSEEARAGQISGKPIQPPQYGVIPPLVKFGHSDYGPYTWPADATGEILGMKCAIVSLPPEQLKCGLLAWSTLGHETGGHDITHADQGLLDELAQKVHAEILKKFNSPSLADYWASCIDESVADICGYLNMGPSIGIGMIGYFRALEDGRLRTIGSKDDPHPIDLLRGYLGAAAVKRLHFNDAEIWSQTIAKETTKDKGTLSLIDSRGRRFPFPVSFDRAVASTEVVADVIMRSKLSTLEDHSLQELVDWKEEDQAIVDHLVTILKNKGKLPTDLRGPGFYAAHVVASVTQAGLQKGANLFTLFNQMKNFLSMMHQENPTWSKEPTKQSIALLEQAGKRNGGNRDKYIVHDSLALCQ